MGVFFYYPSRRNFILPQFLTSGFNNWYNTLLFPVGDVFVLFCSFIFSGKSSFVKVTWVSCSFSWILSSQLKFTIFLHESPSLSRSFVMICNYDSISGETSGLDVKNYSPVFIKTLAEWNSHIYTSMSNKNNFSILPFNNSWTSPFI